MKALSVRQPFASAIFLLANAKDVENRGRSRTHFRGRLLIHAALVTSRENMALYRATAGAISPALLDQDFDALPRGKLLGTVELYDCVQDSPSKWAMAGCWHYLLRKPRLFGRPIPWRGAQGLFDVPDTVIAANS